VIFPVVDNQQFTAILGRIGVRGYSQWGRGNKKARFRTIRKRANEEYG